MLLGAVLVGLAVKLVDRPSGADEPAAAEAESAESEPEATEADTA